MSKTLFVDENELEKIDLGDGFFVKIISEISYQDAEIIFNNSKNENEMTIDMLFSFIKEWNVAEKDGKIAEITKENIKRLPLKLINIIAQEIKPKLELDKKK